MVWNEMKNFVRTQFCKTPERVASAIEAFRLSLTPEKCQNYINKIHEVFISVYRNNKQRFINTVFDLIKGYRYSYSKRWRLVGQINPI